MTNPGVTDLVAYWRMEETSGTRYDSHGLNHLTPIWSPGYDTGIQGNAVNFVSASGQFLYDIDNPAISLGGDVSFTIGLWIKPHAIATNSRILCKWDTPSNDREYHISHLGSKIEFAVRQVGDFTGFSVTADTFGTLSNDTWYFVLAYYDAATDTMGIGVNNVFDTDTGPTGGVRDGTNQLVFGKDVGDAYPYDGLVDEAFIYKDRLLDADERTWMYNSGSGRTYSNLSIIALTTIGIIASPVLEIPEGAQPLPYINIVTTPTGGRLTISVLDSSLKVIGLIEDYYSLTWAERYAEVGDFELDLPIEYVNNSIVDFGNFLRIKTSDVLMIIEDIKPSTGEEESSLVVKGQSTQSLLKRRVLLDPINLKGSAEVSIYSFIEDHITDPINSDRRITLFSTAFPIKVLTPVYEEQVEIQTVYDAIKIICESTGLGFKVTHYIGKLAFHVYEGKDRSYDQSTNPYVIFSDNFDNVIESSFYESIKDKKNITLVVTDDSVEALQRVFVWEASEPTDMSRYESVLETKIERIIGEQQPGETTTEITTPTVGIVGKVCLAAISITATPTIEISTYIPPLTDEEVLAIITTRGRQLIKENKVVGLFEGDFDIQGNFKYGIDFFMGDIVQCNLEGRNVKARIIELVRSYSTKGEKSYVAMDFII